MMDSNILISLIIQIDKNDSFYQIENNLKRFQKYLKNNFTFYEIIVIPNSINFLSHEECSFLIKSFTNLVVISPVEAIDEDLGIRIGVENSIGEKVITCFYDTSIDDLNKITKYNSNDILIGVFENKSSKIRSLLNKKCGFRDYKKTNNIICLSRSHINILLAQYNNNRTFIFIHDLLKLSFKRQVVVLDARARKMGFIFNLLKIARLLYNNHLLKIILFLELIAFTSILFMLLDFKSKYFLDIEIVSNILFKLLTLSSLFLLVSLVCVKLLRKTNKTNKTNYNFYRSNFNYLTKLNVE